MLKYLTIEKILMSYIFPFTISNQYWFEEEDASFNFAGKEHLDKISIKLNLNR